MPRTVKSYRLAAVLSAVLACALVALSGLTPHADADIGNCAVFPADSIWNTRIDTLPVHSNSANFIARIGSGNGLHPDFGTVYNGAPNGIPYIIVPTSQPFVPITLTPYGNQADPGPYPIPTNAPIEGGPNGDGDRHSLILRQGDCQLYELYLAYPNANGSWQAYGAQFDLNSNALRPAGWTSADAAGLSIFAGLVKYDEVQAALASDGVIHHALRFTVPRAYQSYVWPARHLTTTSTNADDPPMGMRFRLKSTFNISSFSLSNQVILRTLKQYGMFVADNGSAWYLSGAPDARWNDDDLHNLQVYVHGSDFEAVDESALMVNPNSGQAAAGPPAASPTRTNTPIASATRTSTATATRTRTPTGVRTNTPTLTPTVNVCAGKPLAPKLVAPSNNAQLSKLRTTLTWNAATCATAYRVQLRIGSSSGVQIVNTKVTVTSYPAQNLARGKSYVWRVRSCDASGCWNWSAWWAFSIKP